MGYFLFLAGFVAGLIAGFITASRQFEKINRASDDRIFRILDENDKYCSHGVLESDCEYCELGAGS